MLLPHFFTRNMPYFAIVRSFTNMHSEATIADGKGLVPGLSFCQRQRLTGDFMPLQLSKLLFGLIPEQRLKLSLCRSIHLQPPLPGKSWQRLHGNLIAETSQTTTDRFRPLPVRVQPQRDAIGKVTLSNYKAVNALRLPAQCWVMVGCAPSSLCVRYCALHAARC